MQILQLLQTGSGRDLWRIFAITCLSGLSNSVLIGLVNSAAEQAAVGEAINLQQAVLFLIAAAIFFLSQRTSMSLANSFLEERLAELRLRLADKIRRSELRTLERVGRGELFTKVVQETNHLSQSFPLLITALQGAAQMTFCLLYIAYLSVVSFVVVAAVTLLGAGVFWFQRQALVVKMAEVTDREAEMLDSLAHFVEGFQEVRLSADRSDALRNHFDGVVTRLRDVLVGIGNTWVVLLMFTNAYIYLLLGAIIFVLPGFFGGYTGIIYKLTAAAFFCVGPVLTITSVAPIYTKASVGLGHVYDLEEVLDSGTKSQDEEAVWLERFQGFREIHGRQILFSYRDRAGAEGFRSGPWDLTIRRGEVLFFLGGNGCGKSTVLKLLTGLYQPEDGSLDVDGVAIDPSHRQAYRELFSCVFTEFHLFDRLHGLPDIPEERVREYLAKFELTDKVDFVDGRFTNLRLSTGQRKRLALIVALLEDREILVLDEWAADQESRFREVFYTELIPELKARGRTVLVVTHDERYFHCCDRVVKLDLGKVVHKAAAPTAPAGMATP